MNHRSDRGEARTADVALIVDAAFFALLLTSAVSYLSSHPLDQLSLAVGVLAVISAVGYGLAARSGSPNSRAWGIVVTLAAWIPLVWVAPSFWWCTFALFLLVRRRLSRWRAVGALVIMSLLCIRAFAVLGDGFDWRVLVGVTVVAVLLDAAYSRIEQQNLQQARSIAELQAAQLRLAETERCAGVLAERERLSRELHDGVTQDLTSAVFLLEAAARISGTRPDDAERTMHSGIAAVRASLAETRSVVHQWHSPRLDDTDLPQALHVMASGEAGVELEVHGQVRQLPHDIAHSVLSVARSALQNAQRHAHAQRIKVTLTFLPDVISLDVRDDGIGFVLADVPPPSAEGGYGLRAMRQRIDQLQGRLDIETDPGSGTTIVAQVPTSEVVA